MVEALTLPRRISVGRSRDNDVVLDDGSVSRRHAELHELGGGRWRILDVGSMNGVFVRREGTWDRVKEADVGPDDLLMLGEAEVSVAWLADPAAAAQPRAAPAAPARIPRPRQSVLEATAREPRVEPAGWRPTLLGWIGIGIAFLLLMLVAIYALLFFWSDVQGGGV